MMTDSPGSPQPARFGRRWFGLLALSLLLHAAVLDWVDGRVGPGSRAGAEAPVVTARLQAEQAVREAAVPPPAAPVKRRPRPQPKPKPAPPEPVADVPPQSSPPLPVPAPEPTPVPPDFATAAAEAPLPEPAEPVATEPPTAQAEPEPEPEPPRPAYKTAPPPSAELKYDVYALREGQKVYGHGRLSWQSDGSRYVATGEAGILFFTVLSFQSEGEIDGFGVAPVLYNEKRFRKSATNTHFHRQRNTISFSASEASYPRSGGEQDRATVIWQLAAIGRGDRSTFAPGAEIDLFVAGVRDAETWRIKVLGEEEIEVGGGKINAWHVARAPRPGSYDQKIDIWYAPQQEWYPVRVRYTEANGDYLELSLSSVTLAAAH